MALAQSHVDLVHRIHSPGGFFHYCQIAYEQFTGRPYMLTRPVSQVSHQIVLCNALEDVFYGRIENLNVIMPPGFLKSTHLILFVTWAYSIYPDCNFIYWSYSRDLAATHTAKIRAIMSLPFYNELFFVGIDPKSRARDNFYTTEGGRVYASGLGGTITGIDAGLPFCPRFSGGAIGDDGHKLSDLPSDTIRAKNHADFDETIAQRTRGVNVPQIYVGQSAHEDDFSQRFRRNQETRPWTTLILRGLNELDQSLAPEIKSAEELIKLRELKPYVFWSQYQGEPTPAGGALFLDKWFVLLDEEPEMLVTFITVDTAETDKSYNDATAFTFFGVYKILENNKETGDLGLHIINNWEIRVEPKDLEQNLMDFYGQCMLYPTTPKFIAIEKKSTGVTLASTVKEMRGMLVREIERTVKSGSKAQRFIDCQGFISKKLVSLPRMGRHTPKVITHMSKISAAMTQQHDDIADTIADAIDLTYISKIAYQPPRKDNANVAKSLTSDLQRRSSLYNQRYTNNGLR